MKNYIVFFFLMLLFGCDEDITQTITKACFDYSPKDDLKAGESIQFSNCSENALSYKWDFGDGQNSDAMSPAHTYQKEGSYKVQLIVTGNNSVDSLSKIVTIEKKTTACFDYSPQDDLKAGKSIQFSNCSENALSYKWDFGDGQTSHDVIPIHTYDRGGSFKVQLFVINSTAIDSMSKIVTVQPIDTLKEIAVGVNEENAITIDFAPAFIKEEYSSKDVILGIAGMDYLKFSKNFNVVHGNLEIIHNQSVTTLNDCEICVRDGKPAVFNLNDKVLVTDTFMKFDRGNLVTTSGDNNYLVIKFGRDKRYIGWLNISSSGNYLYFLKCTYYQLGPLR